MHNQQWGRRLTRALGGPSALGASSELGAFFGHLRGQGLGTLGRLGARLAAPPGLLSGGLLHSRHQC